MIAATSASQIGARRATSGSRRFAWSSSASRLTLCYGTSAVFHGARLSGEPLTRLQRLDHVGIYLLIAGTYTPIAWGLMRGPWLWGTLTAAWTTALVCGTRVLVRRPDADVAFDTDLPRDGVGRPLLLQRAGPDPFAPKATASSPGWALLQRRGGHEPHALAGTCSRVSSPLMKSSTSL